MCDQLNEINSSDNPEKKINKITDVEIMRDANLNIDQIDFNFAKKSPEKSVAGDSNEAKTNVENEKFQKNPPTKISPAPDHVEASEVDLGKIPDVKTGHEDGLDDLLDDLF